MMREGRLAEIMRRQAVHADAYDATSSDGGDRRLDRTTV
jgi:hypothetical protein